MAKIKAKSTNPAIATKMDYDSLITTRTIVRAIPILITLTAEHLLNFNHLNRPKLTAMRQLIDIPVLIV